MMLESQGPARPPRADLVRPDEIWALVVDLESTDPVVRTTARKTLAEIGEPAVEALVVCLYHPEQHVRWEAVKTLEAVASPAAAPALVDAMDDEDQDVRWVAAEALVVLSEAALPWLLSGLIRRSSSPGFCSSAHHALHELAVGPYKAVLQPVLEALRLAEPAVFAPTNAWKALKQIAFDGL